jgi:two-component system, NarL family, sensor histidine kinase UhpB
VTAIRDSVQRYRITSAVNTADLITAEREEPNSVQPVSVLTSVQPAAVRRRPLLRGLWRGRSVRSQLLLVFVLIDIVALIVGGSVAVLRARTQARVETTASMGLAEALVRDAIALAHQQVPAGQFLANLPVQLRSIRHVRIAVRDASGIPIGATPAAQGTDGTGASAPGWFAKLVALPIESRELPVIINGIKVGDVQIVGEPADEIAEFWENAIAMAVTVALLNVAMVGILYILFGRVLDPLSILAAGLSDLKRQNYDVRMPKPRARELTAITDHFNALARSLETARTENVRLNRQLVTAQDDERRRTALELHDEVGPCLFGLKANASSIASVAAELPEQAKQSIAERLRDTFATIDHLQAINRSMLGRLRPMALGHVPLAELIDQLVRDYGRRHSQIAFSIGAEGLQPSYGDSIDLTVYRCVQESLTNAVRHAQARNVTVGLKHNDAESRLTLTVRDDGCGIYPGKLAGFGMRGMRERVEGLAGYYAIHSQAGAGTCVQVTLPLAEAGYVMTKPGVPGVVTA